MINAEELQKLHHEVTYDYHAMVTHVENKYNINIEENNFEQWALDHFLGKIYNGSFLYINWNEAFIYASESEKHNKETPYTHILKFFVIEFGEKYWPVVVSS